MRPKKNPQLDLRKNSLLYFMVGMTFILLLTFLALEWKTFDPKSDWDIGQLDPNLLPDEEVPITFQKLPEPPKPKIQTPPKIEIADDEDDIVEPVIEPDDTNQDTPVAEVDDIKVEEEEIDEEIPIISVENVPIFPGCEGETTEKGKRDCFQEMMKKHIRKNFRYPEVAQEMGLQGRVDIRFTIEKNGDIGNIKFRGPHETLENEATRIISKLPTMTPGKQGGKQVKVTYTLPITFKLN
ncbi:energy transducer TonB [Flagellimonas zhangzhouensis]|uniref:Outer membrane transport energization protein TonB (TC 2.C.1.1.1) n=1 Tax=Flagellimonas zhangzhouensis TaxID=1073328 RepID=A0A1H2X693_9FLAO|nr:energy transducer TonB [Allomuricauda zhangzhouensis]SDQ28509.1 protein TonB [Allomuricauda zhangzhouensis]SDW88315.1 outer membrane transport energization protein TonB (TC 2.C.1.1.1) [Allomuricauda zhangzhouensis]